MFDTSHELAVYHTAFHAGERIKMCVAVDTATSRALVICPVPAGAQIVSDVETYDELDAVWITGAELRTSRPDLCELADCECPRILV